MMNIKLNKRKGTLAWLMIFAGLLLFFGCTTPTIRNKSDLRKYVNSDKSGLSVRLEKNGIMSVLTYLPPQLLESRVLSANTAHESQSGTSNRSYFVLSFSKDNKELLSQMASQDYSTLIRLFSFGMQKLISIRSGSSKEFSADECFFQPTYGLGGSNELTIVFDNQKLPDNSSMAIRVKEFGLGMGDLVFTFNRADIDRINQLKLRN